MYSLDDLLTLDQAAQKLHVSRKTIRNWRYERRIPFTRIGRRIYVSAGVVEGILNANAIPALADHVPPVPKPTGQGGVARKGSEK